MNIKLFLACAASVALSATVTALYAHVLFPDTSRSTATVSFPGCPVPSPISGSNLTAAPRATAPQAPPSPAEIIPLDTAYIRREKTNRISWIF